MFPVLINAKQAFIPLSYYLNKGQRTPADEIVEELLLYIFYWLNFPHDYFLIPILLVCGIVFKPLA